jgi:hypothetical protein
LRDPLKSVDIINTELGKSCNDVLSVHINNDEGIDSDDLIFSELLSH